jgi:hypothetical protein
VVSLGRVRVEADFMNAEHYQRWDTICFISGR